MTRHGSERFDFGPVDDDYRGFDLQEEETARGPLILALAVGVLIVFAGVVWNTYRQGVRDGASDVPFIRADSQDYKRRPEQAGGTSTPGLDTRIYDEMDGSDRQAGPAPGDTEAASAADQRIARGAAGQNAADDMMLQGGPPLELRPGLTQDDTETPDQMPRELEPKVQELANLETGAEPMRGRTRDTVPAATPDPRVPEDEGPSGAPEEAPASPPAPRFEFAPAGDYLVQVAAFRNEPAANTAWQTRIQANPDIYRGATKRIQRADLGARGIFFRLQVAAFETRPDANAFCAALKDMGKDCIVVRK